MLCVVDRVMAKNLEVVVLRDEVVVLDSTAVAVQSGEVVEEVVLSDPDMEVVALGVPDIEEEVQCVRNQVAEVRTKTFCCFFLFNSDLCYFLKYFYLLFVTRRVLNLTRQQYLVTEI